MRNFNFRCNLDEIDKIIEEDTQSALAKQEDASNISNIQESPAKVPLVESVDIEEV